MFYIQAFSCIGLIFVLWVSTCCFDFVAIASIFLLLLLFPPLRPYSLDCCSQPREQHFLLALILNYLFHVRLIQTAFGIQISWAWHRKPQSSSWEKNGHPRLIKAKRVGRACRQRSVPTGLSPAEPSPLPQFGRRAPPSSCCWQDSDSCFQPQSAGEGTGTVSGWLAESDPLYTRTCDVLPWLFPCSWQMRLPLLYV